MKMTRPGLDVFDHTEMNLVLQVNFPVLIEVIYVGVVLWWL